MFERIEVGSPNRPWATALAFVVNSTALTLAILLPMIRPDQLPALNFRELSVPYTAPPREIPDTQPTRPSAGPTRDQIFRAPSTIPIHVSTAPDNLAESQQQTFISGMERIGSAFPVTGLPMGISTNPPPVAVPTKPPRPQKLIISHLDEGMLLRRVQPAYPRIAISTRTQGSVVLSALINTRGEIEGLQVVSGPPLLVQAALEAVKQWRYRPYILNGTPIEVQTQVTVNFSLQ
jgi:periplasmic protein TonB